MSNKNRLIGFSILFFCLLSMGVISMPLSDLGKVCLFSGISGVITLEGEPVKHAKLKRIVGRAHTQGEKIDEATTDEKGYFQMPPVYDRSIASKILPMEFSVPQEIFVIYEDKEYKIWNGVKRNRDENAESNGKPLIVECELNSEKKNTWVNGGAIVSLCTWDVVPDNMDTGF